MDIYVLNSTRTMRVLHYDGEQSHSRISVKMQKAKYTDTDAADGVHTYQLAHWTEFHDFIEQHIFKGNHANRPSYIWRGQQNSA